MDGMKVMIHEIPELLPTPYITENLHTAHEVYVSTYNHPHIYTYTYVAACILTHMNDKCLNLVQ